MKELGFDFGIWCLAGIAVFVGLCIRRPKEYRRLLMLPTARIILNFTIAILLWPFMLILNDPEPDDPPPPPPLGQS